MTLIPCLEGKGLSRDFTHIVGWKRLEQDILRWLEAVENDREAFCFAAHRLPACVMGAWMCHPGIPFSTNREIRAPDLLVGLNL